MARSAAHAMADDPAEQWPTRSCPVRQQCFKIAAPATAVGGLASKGRASSRKWLRCRASRAQVQQHTAIKVVACTLQQSDVPCRSGSASEWPTRCASDRRRRTFQRPALFMMRRVAEEGHCVWLRSSCRPPEPCPNRTHAKARKLASQTVPITRIGQEVLAGRVSPVAAIHDDCASRAL